MFFALIIGFAGGIIVATTLNVHKPVEVVITNTAPTPLESSAASVTPVRGAPAQWSESNNISVEVPQRSALAKSPLAITGQARVFEGQVSIRLKDGKDQELGKTIAVAKAPDAGLYGTYRAELTFEKSKTKTGTLEVFQVSAKDSNEVDKVTIPLRFE